MRFKMQIDLKIPKVGSGVIKFMMKMKNVRLYRARNIHPEEEEEEEEEVYFCFLLIVMQN